MSTPMFDQYLELKAAHPDAILFFRMGDFYEMFYEDARVAADVLDLTLTARNKHKDPIPMAGVPHHAATGYIQKLVEHGHKVAIAEQVEDPALAKGLVRREVVRVVTPGVVLAADALEARRANYLVTCAPSADKSGRAAFALAFLDASTGDLRTTITADVEAASAEIARLEPREGLLHPDLQDPARAELIHTLKRIGAVTSALDADAWTLREARRALTEATGVEDPTAFGVAPDGAEVVCAGVAIRYAREAAGGALGHVSALVPYRTAGSMVLDEMTIRNLELFRTLLAGKRKGSLLWLLDETRTAMGARLLREWLCYPLLDPAAIRDRQSAVGWFVEASDQRAAVAQLLREVGDVERICGRVATGSASPRDLASLRSSLVALPKLIDMVADPAVARLAPDDPCADVAGDLCHWLADEPPLQVGDGGVIRRGADPELDALERVSVDAASAMVQLEERERKATGINSLKVRTNDQIGYFIEITKANLHRVPSRYIRKQAMSNGERFITPELKELEEHVLGAEGKRKALESERFFALRERVAGQAARLIRVARAVAALDVLVALAVVASERRWVRPDLDDRPVLDVRGGRHPVVEALLDEERFVPNDLLLHPEAARFVILTGPNMAGKSTIMRQMAVIVVLAHVGSFVPADSATVGLCDRVFTRVGASDDLTRGASTFMVEMSETASILRGATDRSLVLLDEIGRGTATYDGLSIAWAVAEDLVDRVRCRGIFATHYHEMCDLADTRPGVANLSIAVKEWGDTILFLRKLKAGGASRSYGIQCARIAGVPRSVLDRARELLTRFEKHAPRGARDQLSLFGGFDVTAAAPDPEPAPDALRVALAALDPDSMAPRDALAALYRLRSLLDE
jgi:DNA mismatch repair protein MutS